MIYYGAYIPMERLFKSLHPQTPDTLSKIDIPVVRIEWNGYYYYAWCNNCPNNSAHDVTGKTLAISDAKSHSEFTTVMNAARIHKFHEPTHNVIVYDVTEAT